jgi:hypothetical protein
MPQMTSKERQHMQKALDHDYQKVFLGQSTPDQGMRVLFDIINRCEMYKCNTKDAHQEAVLTGKRSIGVYLMERVMFAPAYGEPLTPEHVLRFNEAADTAKDRHDVQAHDAAQQK